MKHEAAIILAFNTIYLGRKVTIGKHWIDAEDYAPIHPHTPKPVWFGAGNFPSEAVVHPVHTLLLDAVTQRENFNW